MLGEDIWKDITNRIDEIRVFIFLVSKETLQSQGQSKELEMAIAKVEGNAPLKLLPLAVGDVHFSSFPLALRHINGERLDAHNVGNVALKIGRTYFPEIIEEWSGTAWHYPIPAQWLEVCSLDSVVGENFQVGDKVYFRRLSPMGLFECYAPRIKQLFWFAPENLRPTDPPNQSDLVPTAYQILAMVRSEAK